MRTLFTFVVLVSAVLVPWSSLAPSWLPDASGSAISSNAMRLRGLAVRLSPSLGILPLAGPDEAGPDGIESESLAPEAAAALTTTHSPRIVCENGVCRLVDGSDWVPDGTEPSNPQLESARQKLQSLGAAQIRLELDSLGDWRCYCSMPVSPGSKVMRRFEAAAKSDCDAVRTACSNVESWLHDRR